jgi:hypothetical protein
VKTTHFVGVVKWTGGLVVVGVRSLGGRDGSLRICVRCAAMVGLGRCVRTRELVSGWPAAESALQARVVLTNAVPSPSGQLRRC